jgi:hypothetical protein
VVGSSSYRVPSMFFRSCRRFSRLFSSVLGMKNIFE